MKKILIASLIIPFILISCGKSEEVRSTMNLPVEKQVILDPSMIQNSNESNTGKVEKIASRIPSNSGSMNESGKEVNNFKKIEGNIYKNNEIRINLFENSKVYIRNTGMQTIMFGPLGPNLGPTANNAESPIYELNIKEKLLENELIEQIKKKELLISGPIKEKINGFDTIKWTAGGFCEERGIILLGVEKNYEFTSMGCSTEEKSDFNYFIKVIHTLEFLK